MLKQESNRFYAGELRAMGFDLPDDIPDCANVPREAVKWEYACKPGKDGAVDFSLKASISAPFEWVQLDAVISGT